MKIFSFVVKGFCVSDWGVKMNHLARSLSGKKFLPVSLTLILVTSVFLGVTQSPANGTDKQQIVRQVACKWIEVGKEQYERGFFKASEQSFLRAQDYEAYLTAEEKDELKQLLEKTHIAAIGRNRVLQHISAGEEFLALGEIVKAKAHFDKANGSKFLTSQEQEKLTQDIEQLRDKLLEKKNEIAEIYNRSVEYYRNDELEKARDGFLKIADDELLAAPAGKTAKDYLVEIDNVLAQRAEFDIKQPEMEKATDIVEEPVVEDACRVESVPVITCPEEVEVEEGGYIEVINRKRSILCSHTKAVVDDAVAKSQVYILESKFDKAQGAIELAERNVSKNQLYLGEDLFREYDVQLKQLSEEIAQKKKESSLKLADQSRAEAIEKQRKYREQVEIDRQKRVGELMENAMAYQQQQRYEESLGQLENLLAIDPQNNQALILQQTLQDTVSFRRQLEVQKEFDKERVDILVKTNEALIPYADEIRYPKNWREIVAKRKPDEAIGEDPANAEVYRNMDKIVNLSELTAEMSFGEAIDLLKKSVEPQLKVVVLWRDLSENADIDQSTPINMDPIPAVSLGTGLELLLKSVSGGFAELGYVVEDGVTTIATVESLPSKSETLVYDVTDLLGRPARYNATTSGGGSSGSGSGSEDVGGGFTDEDDEEDYSVEEMEERAVVRANNLVYLIQDTVEPSTWYEAGGEGSITVYENKKLIVRQTREIHNNIKKLLAEMRKSLGHQVAIEARFLLVGENFLEDIGLDVDFRFNLGGKLGSVGVQQGSYNTVRPLDTGVTGSLPDTVSPTTLSGGYGGPLDDLQVTFLLRATQAHRDSMALTAPKVSVLSGESASLRLQKVLRYARDIEVDTRESGDSARQSFTVNYEDGSVTSGTILNVIPTITPDKKHVLLDVTAELRDFLGFRVQSIPLPVFGPDIAGSGASYDIAFPETEVSRVQTRVSVPDGGTLLLGGQKLTVNRELESGVPGLSKMPIIGRLFNNRSKVEDHKILLILIKPTIILQEEAEAEALAALEGDI